MGPVSFSSGAFDACLCLCTREGSPMRTYAFTLSARSFRSRLIYAILRFCSDVRGGGASFSEMPFSSRNLRARSRRLSPTAGPEETPDMSDVGTRKETLRKRSDTTSVHDGYGDIRTMCRCSSLRTARLVIADIGTLPKNIVRLFLTSSVSFSSSSVGFFLRFLSNAPLKTISAVFSSSQSPSS